MDNIRWSVVNYYVDPWPRYVHWKKKQPRRLIPWWLRRVVLMLLGMFFLAEGIARLL